MSQFAWRDLETSYGRMLSVALILLGSPVVGFADAAADVSALEAKCEAEREAKIAPLREQEIAKCKADRSNTPDYCDRYWKDYGAARRGATGGMIPRMFDDLPVCQEAFKARKALADGN